MKVLAWISGHLLQFVFIVGAFSLFYTKGSLNRGR